MNTQKLQVLKGDSIQNGGWLHSKWRVTPFKMEGDSIQNGGSPEKSWLIKICKNLRVNLTHLEKKSSVEFFNQIIKNRAF